MVHSIPFWVVWSESAWCSAHTAHKPVKTSSAKQTSILLSQNIYCDSIPLWARYHGTDTRLGLFTLLLARHSGFDSSMTSIMEYQFWHRKLGRFLHGDQFFKGNFYQFWNGGIRRRTKWQNLDFEDYSPCTMSQIVLILLKINFF